MTRRTASLLLTLLSTILGSTPVSATEPYSRISLSADYAAGFYGDTEKSQERSLNTSIRHEQEPFAFKVNIPLIQSEGVAAAGGDRNIFTRQTQSGLGDITTTVSLFSVAPGSGFRSAIGVKLKLATADKKKELLTTGKTDLSVFVDASRPFGSWEPYLTLGATQKGDPDGIDYRNPLYGSTGWSHHLAEHLSWGVAYDYRQKLTSFGSPVSEASLFVELRLPGDLRLETYWLTGFSDASPDSGGGLLISVGY